MDAMTGLNQATNSWNSITALSDYHENASYDANGNIKTYLRNGTTDGGTSLAMDDLDYNYNFDGNGQLINNKLTSVSDAVASANYSDDIDNQAPNNYSYDAIGNMTGDVSGNIQNITWTVYGKIATITKTDGTTVAYSYDAAGNRISKTVTPNSGQATTTWYVRDASGNTMAVYTASSSGTLSQSEQDLYGSSRLGIFNRNIDADASLPAGTSANLIGNYFTGLFTRGNKAYELSNHLGNVLATISDKKAGVDNNSDGTVDYYTADVISANDYYPFGMGMPGRKYSIANTNYRYGFNGKEKSDEINGNGTDYNYGARILDVRLGRFFSVDPLAANFPFLGSYQFSSNTPISATDIEGKESKVTMTTNNSLDVTLTTSTSDYIQSSTREASMEVSHINKLIPQLIIPKTNGLLSDPEKQSIIKETVSEYLSWNYTESIKPGLSGEKLYQSLTSDINYRKLFGSHTKDKVAMFKSAFSVLNTFTEMLPTGEGKIGEVQNFVTAGGFVGDLQNQEYLAATATAVKTGAELLISKSIEYSVKKSLLPVAAKFVGSASLQTIFNTLTPLDAGVGSSLNENLAARRSIEMRNLRATTVSALLFYFINGNKLEFKDGTSTIKSLQTGMTNKKDETLIHK